MALFMAFTMLGSLALVEVIQLLVIDCGYWFMPTKEGKHTGG